MEPFRDDILMVYVHLEDGKLIATGNHPNMMLLHRVVPSEDLTEQLQAPAYLGALSYLRSLLASSMMQGGNMFIDYQEKEGKKVYTKSIKFLSNRLDANFECTNPELIKEKDIKTKFSPFMTDYIDFKITKDLRKEFDEVARFNTPKADLKLFRLKWDGSYIRALFGSGKHTTSLILDKINSETKPFEKLLSLDRFRAMIRLAAENTGDAYFHEKAFWTKFPTDHAIHTVVTPTIRDQNK